MNAVTRVTILIAAFAVGAAIVKVGSDSLTRTVHAQTTKATTPPANPPAAGTAPAASNSLWDAITGYDGAMLIWGPLLAIVIIIGGAVLLYLTIGKGANPLILQLTPSFFFWLAMMYTALLLLMAVLYSWMVPMKERPILLGGILPIAVPWFGALGAVTISLEGVFLWNQQWERRYNYWHIGRPLFGAVLGLVAFFLFIVILTASGSPPVILDKGKALGKDYIIFYVLAFLVGYREETFRELIKRATDLILKPAPPAQAPAVTFKVAGGTPTSIQAPNIVHGGALSSVTVEVQNSGTAPLAAPKVTIAPVAPTPAGVFAIASDHVTGADLPAGQARTIDVTFRSANPGSFTATLTVSGANLATAKTISVMGTAT